MANGELPRASAVELIVVAFPVTRQAAERMLGTIGAGFVPTAPEPEFNPFGGGGGGFGGPPKQDKPPEPEPPVALKPEATKQLSAVPKAQAPDTPGPTMRSRPTSSRSPSPFAQTRRAESVASASSSPKRSPRQP